MIEDYRRRLFRIYLQHAPEHIGKIPDLLQEHGSTKASLDALVARALWEHLAKGSGECPTGIQMQPTLDASSDSAGSSKRIDTEVGRVEADKERVVCEMEKEINLTFERKSVGGEPQYIDKYLEWISSQKWKSYDTCDSRGRQVRVKIHPTHTWVKRTQWNAHCRKTTYFRERSGQWTICEDMASHTEW